MATSSLLVKTPTLSFGRILRMFREQRGYNGFMYNDYIDKLSILVSMDLLKSKKNIEINQLELKCDNKLTFIPTESRVTQN